MKFRCLNAFKNSNLVIIIFISHEKINRICALFSKNVSSSTLSELKIDPFHQNRTKISFSKYHQGCQKLKG